MKHHYLLSTYVDYATVAWHLFSSKCKAISVFTLLFTFLGFSNAFGQVTVNTANGSINSCTYSTNYVALGNIFLEENQDANFNIILQNSDYTLIITAPTNFEFRPSVGTTAFRATGDITAASINVTATTITVTYRSSDGNRTNNDDRLTISGIEFRGITAPSTGNMTRTALGGGTGTISGAASESIYGTLTSTNNPLGVNGGGAASVCVGATTPAFSNATPGGTWSITNGTGSAIITAGGIATGIAAGGVTVVYTLNGCVSNRALTVNPTPGVIGGGAATVCVGATTPAFTNIGGGTWSIINGSGSATILGTGVVTGVTAGSATVVYTIGTCTASTPITIIATPTITTNPANASTSIGGAASFTVVGNNTPTSYTWQVSTDGGFTWATVTNGGVYSTATTATLNITGATLAMNGYRYRASATNGCGTSAYSTSATLIVSLIYCTPIGTNDTYPISNVTFAGINNNSSALVSAGPDYQDFSAIIGNVTAGSTYNFSITSTGFSPNPFYQYVFFDWNNNGNFTDDGGAYTIGTYTANTATSNLNILIPVTATVGSIRMRVGNSFSAIYDPCITTGGNFQFEDYTINIAAAPVCTEPTGQPTTLLLTPGATSINGSFTAASPVPQNYLVVMNTTNIAPTGLINDGTTYPIGSSIGVGNTVVDTDSNLTFTAGGLNTTSTYYFFIYSLNALCSGGPLYNTNATVLTGNATTVGAPAGPCVPVTNTARNQDKYISRVAFIGTLVETNNVSTFTDVTPGYQDFTILALKAQQAQGQGVNIIVESFGGRAKLYAWVDWNKNGTFEDSEKVYGPPAAGISSTFGFVIPSGTVPGNYRIRFRTFNSYYNDGNGANGNPDEYFGLNFNACQLFDTGTVGAFPSNQYGEAEDYLFTVVQRCAANITSVVNGSVCGSGVVDLVANGTTGTTLIRWYDALTGGNFLGDSASGGTFETPSIVATTTYYCTAYNGTCESFERTAVVAVVNPTPTLTFTQSSPDVCGEGAIVALTAGGDKVMTNLLIEKFEGGGLGAFTTINTDATPIATENDAKWTNRASTFVPTSGLSWKPAISSGLAPNLFALATSDTGTPPDQLIENSLTSGTLNSTGYLNLTMTMKFYYSRYLPDNTSNADEFVTIDISINDGATWTTLQTFTADTGIGTKFTNLSYNINGYINRTQLKVRILHHSLGDTNGYLPDGVAVDDVRIFGDLPMTTAFTWTGTPLPDVYSNPAGTTPYVPGSPIVTVYVKPNLAQLEMGSYTFTATAVLSNGCTANQDVTIMNKSKIWKGTTDNNWYNAANWNPVGIPDASTCVIIPDIANSGNRPSEINTAASSAFGKSLDVKANGILKLYPSNNLTITNAIIVAGTGLINMENSSNLVQIANVANTGNINMKRTANVRKQDYVYWSSPVAGFANSAVSPGTNLGYQYKWLPTTGGINNFGNWTLSNETMVLGKGYIVRGPDAYSLSAAANYTASFIGVPNNGDIPIQITRGIYDGVNYPTGVSTTPGTKDDDNWNLVGNPYPSAIDARKFLTLNTNIAGFINVWTHGTLPSTAISDPFYNNYAYNYTPGDYITYNSSGVSSGPGTFNGFIGAGQGFFVSMLHASATPSNLIFNNTLRRDIPTGNTYNNGQFFRTANSNATTNELESHRIWLDLVTQSGTSTRSLLGYVENATNENDRLFDAFASEKLSFNIFSLIEDEQMLIQGRKLPFDANDKVNIGVSIPQDGLYKIAIGAVDGLFLDAKQNIYLEDKLLKIVYNLKEAPYAFMGKKGVTKDRFALRYAKDTNKNIVELTNQLTVYDNNILTVESGKLKIKNIQIFDISGKQLLTKNDVNNKNYQVTNLNRTNSLMIVKVTLEDNSEEVRKVMY